jgi:hypothetical protein
VIEKIVPMIMKNQRPTMAWRIWSRARSRLRPTNRSIAAPCWPNVFDSRIPDTDRVSSVTADISASDSWVSLRTWRLALPTRYVRYMKNGSSPSESSVSRQSIRNITTIVLTAIAMFDVTEAAVSVTTDWIPPTSFARRLWISPVFVPVKKRSGIDWRWVYRAVRRSCMTDCPMTLLR